MHLKRDPQCHGPFEKRILGTFLGIEPYECYSWDKIEQSNPIFGASFSFHPLRVVLDGLSTSGVSGSV